MEKVGPCKPKTTSIVYGELCCVEFVGHVNRLENLSG